MTTASRNPSVPSSSCPGQPPADLAKARTYNLLSRPRHSLRLATLDDHPVITAGAAAFFRSQTDFELLVSETSVDAFIEALKRQPCDAAVVDFYLPEQLWDGMDFIRRLRRQFPKMIIVIFSAGNAEETEFAAFRAGAHGYLPKLEPLPVLADMIRLAVSSPCAFICYRDGRLQCRTPQHPDTKLTTTELEILRHISQGLSVTQVAERLLRSKKTISTHKRRAMKKLGLADDLSLALYIKEKFQQTPAQ